MPSQIPFREQYNHPNWKDKRKEVLAAHDHTCECCGTDKELQVHHKVYRKGKMAWEYDNDDLMCLCRVCHIHEHDKWDEFRETLARLSWSGREGVYAHARNLLEAELFGFSSVFGKCHSIHVGKAAEEVLDELRACIKWHEDQRPI